MKFMLLLPLMLAAARFALADGMVEAPIPQEAATGPALLPLPAPVPLPSATPSQLQAHPVGTVVGDPAGSIPAADQQFLQQGAAAAAQMKEQVDQALAAQRKLAPWQKDYWYEGFDKIYAGETVRFGTPVDNLRTAFMAPAIEHKSEDGYWLIPGVDWNLLGVGLTVDKHFADTGLLLGPSIDLGGPLDALILKGINALPSSGKNADCYSALKGLVAPGNVKLALGPMWEGTLRKNAGGSLVVKGWFDAFVALSVKWGKKS